MTEEAVFSSEEVAEKDPADSLDPPKKIDTSPLMTIEEAKQQIGEEILSVMAEKFNGKLSEVRPVDSKDILF